MDVNEASRVGKIDEQTKERPKRRAFTDAELKAILAACNTEWRGMVLVGAYAGLRLRDVACLRWQNVDLTTREMRFTSQKTGREMVVPIVDPLHSHLVEIAGMDDPDAPLFPEAFQTRADKKDGLSNRFYRVMVKAGVVEAAN